MDTSPKRQRLTIFLLIFLCCCSAVQSQRRRLPLGGTVAVVVDERLSALRETPEFSGRLVRRLGRGRLVSIRTQKLTKAGVMFCRVNVTRRTSGWIQRDALVSPHRRGDDARLLRLIQGSDEFDRLARARIFLDTFPRSPLRPQVLLVFGEAAEAAATKLSNDAARRLNPKDIEAGGAPEFSYFLNYNGLDRYNRQGVSFIFDRQTRRFHYSGEAWREINRRYPHSPEATEARLRLQKN